MLLEVFRQKLFRAVAFAGNGSSRLHRSQLDRTELLYAVEEKSSRRAATSGNSGFGKATACSSRHRPQVIWLMRFSTELPRT